MELYGGPGIISLDTNSTSVKPQLPPNDIAKNPFFPLNEPGSLRFYPANLTDNKDQCRLIKGPTLFAVTDDLLASTPPASTSSILDRMKIPPSDIDQEALRRLLPRFGFNSWSQTILKDRAKARRVMRLLVCF